MWDQNNIREESKKKKAKAVDNDAKVNSNQLTHMPIWHPLLKSLSLTLSI